jgi:Kef-type K+ transport system membrane component KefB
MVPRGEVGLIFAQMGSASGVFDSGLFGAVTLMVIVTTLIAPPALKLLLRRPATTEIAPQEERLGDLVNTA